MRERVADCRPYVKQERWLALGGREAVGELLFDKVLDLLAPECRRAEHLDRNVLSVFELEADTNRLQERVEIIEQQLLVARLTRKSRSPHLGAKEHTQSSGKRPCHHLGQDQTPQGHTNRNDCVENDQASDGERLECVLE